MMFLPFGVSLTDEQIKELAIDIDRYTPPHEHRSNAVLTFLEYDHVARTFVYAAAAPIPSDSRTAGFVLVVQTVDGVTQSIDLPLATATLPVAEQPTFSVPEDSTSIYYLIPVKANGQRGDNGPTATLVASDPAPLTETGNATLSLVSSV